MIDNSTKVATGESFNRRGFVTSAAAIGSGLLACNLKVESAYARQLSQERRETMTADEIIDLMKKGNERFRKGESRPRNFLAEQRASAKGQYPAAVVLSCIDSRTPAEIILDVGIGDIFNTRVAGNIANEDVLGSLEFACKVAGAKVILVMGHTSCGAIKGSIDNVELGNLTGLLAKMRPAVTATAFEGKRTSKELAFVDAVARKNVEATITHIREKSAVLRELESKKSVKIVGSMYNLETAVVEFFA